MAAPTYELAENLRWSRVVSVSDDGEVVLRLPDGQFLSVTIPQGSVPLVRRLAEIDGEIDRDSRHQRG
jgi:hypothetical protein